MKRPPIQFLCADKVPCYDIHATDVYMWSQTDEAVMKCESAYGGGACLNHGQSHTSYSVHTTSYTKPAEYTAPATLSGDLSDGFATDSPIPTPYVLFSLGVWSGGRALIVVV